jgi:tetratricopeptide (TPR) repeat protein
MANALLAYWASRVASADSEARIVAAIEIARSRISEGDASGGADPADLALAAKLLGEAGRVWAMSGRADVARGWAEEAARFADASGDPAARVQALSGLGVAYAFSGRGYDPQEIFGQAIDLAQASGTWWVVAMSAGFSGASTYHQDPVSAEALVARGVEAAARSGSPYAIGAAAMARGRMLGLKREPDAAAASFEESMRRFTEIGDLRLALAARSDMAHALRRSGRFDEAMAVYRQTVDEWVHLGNRGAVGSQLENVAYVAIERGELARAATLLGAAEAIRETASSRMAWDEIGEFEAYVARLREALPGPELDAAWSQGRGSSLRTAVELVRAG